ncbi:MAG: hypothetical protein LBM75_07230 [Myxococcales bacterium]|jgi:hypothetical protein|nr:hypothetical protein [Myxococcales bacterium]
MVDRFTIPLIVNPAADEAAEANPTGPWKTELLRNRVSTEVENPYGEIGEAYSHGPEVIPFDDIYVISAEQGVRHEYERLCEFLEGNPQRALRLLFSTGRPSLIRDLSFTVVRDEPFLKYRRQAVPLAAYVTQDSENNTAVSIDLKDTVFDSWTYLELSLSTLPAARETVTMIVETNGGVDVRKQIR